MPGCTQRAEGRGIHELEGGGGLCRSASTTYDEKDDMLARGGHWCTRDTFLAQEEHATST